MTADLIETRDRGVRSMSLNRPEVGGAKRANERFMLGQKIPAFIIKLANLPAWRITQ